MPDGTDYKAWRVRDAHVTVALAAGLDVTAALLREHIPTGSPSGRWYDAGSLLSPGSGRTLARDTHASTLA